MKSIYFITFLTVFFFSIVFFNCDEDTSPPETTEPVAQTWEEFIKNYQPYLDVSSAGDQFATADQLAALNYVNFYRFVAGVDYISFLPQANNAAEHHATYFAFSPSSGSDPHLETDSSNSNFTGTSVVNRLNHLSYYLASGEYAVERMTYLNSPTLSIDQMMSEVYSRGILLNPNCEYLGFKNTLENSIKVDVLVITYKNEFKNKVAVYPRNGQKYLPTSINSNLEDPDPLPYADIVGYPISIHFPSFSGNTVQNINISLKDQSMLDIPIYRIDPSSDSNSLLKNDLFVFSQSTLQNNIKYSIYLSADFYNSSITSYTINFSSSWTFTTNTTSTK